MNDAIFDQSANAEQGLVDDYLRPFLLIALSLDAAVSAQPGHLLAQPVTELPGRLNCLPPTSPVRLYAQDSLDSFRRLCRESKRGLADREKHPKRASALRAGSGREHPPNARLDATLDECSRQPALGFENMLLARRLVLLCGCPSVSMLHVVLPVTLDAYPDGTTDASLYLAEVGAKTVEDLQPAQRWELLAQVWEWSMEGPPRLRVQRGARAHGYPAARDSRTACGGGLVVTSLVKTQRAPAEAVVSPQKIPAGVPQLAEALRNPEVCGLRIGFDRFTGHIMLADLNSDPPQWRNVTDEDYTRLRERLERYANFSRITKDNMRDVAAMVAHEQAFDSAQQWIQSLKWDGVPRVHALLHRYFRAEDSPYTRAVSMYVMTALAGRVIAPGTKADMVPVAVGAQGARKSSAIAALVPDPAFFGELDLSRRDDDTARILQGKLVVELPELKGLRARDVDSTKAFISALFDEWVEKYKVHAVKRPRRCLLFGSTNEPAFLTDATGARRWLPFAVGTCDPDALARDRDQLWAEARVLFLDRGGAVSFEEAEVLARVQHAMFEVDDPWRPIIAGYLDPDHQASPAAAAPAGDDRDHSGPGPFDILAEDGPKSWVTSRELMENALDLKPSQMNKATEQHVGAVLRSLGWVPKQRRINGKPVSGWMRGA